MSFAHLGNAWTLWPPHNQRGGLNIVGGYRVISAQIISVCLTRPGEDPMHPDKGIAPELFEATSGYQPQYWLYTLRQEILKWVAGLEQLALDTTAMPDVENRLKASIQFVPSNQPVPHILTFDYYAYQGALWDQGLAPFLDSITLDGRAFRALAP